MCCLRRKNYEENIYGPAVLSGVLSLIANLVKALSTLCLCGEREINSTTKTQKGTKKTIQVE